MIIEAAWKDIEPFLSPAAQKIVVKRISGKSEDVPRLPTLACWRKCNRDWR